MNQITRVVWMLLFLAVTFFAVTGSVSARHVEELSEEAVIHTVVIPPEDETLVTVVIPPEDEPMQPVGPETVKYQIHTGDTLFKIAKDFGISIESLSAFNEITNPNRLSLGQVLQIPVFEAGLKLPDGQGKVIQKVINTTLTAYTAGMESTGKRPGDPAYGITYSGIKATEGRTVAVDPRIIPLGSTVYIDGIGVRTAEDTGSAIQGARIDVFMNDLLQARSFGVKKNIKVYVLTNA